MSVRGGRPLVAWILAVTGCLPVAEGDSWPVAPDPAGVATTALTVVDPRVWYDPYGAVRWDTALRLKAQTHDHTGLLPARLLSYDSAGYAFVPLMDYSGVASLGYAQRRRLWPSDSVLPSTVLASPTGATWVPSAEEVGYQHITSLFLTQYIAKWEPSQYGARESWMYDGTQESIDLVARLGGFPILAHPWGVFDQFGDLGRYRGIEIYSAYAEHLFEVRTTPYFAEANRNGDIVTVWDRVLMRGRFIVGVAVNDHYGPYRPLTQVSRRVRDSGKIIVLTPDRSLQSYRDAMEEGALFAVKDLGEAKGQLPVIDSITVTGTAIRVWTTAAVTWIVDGAPLMGSTSSLNVATLPGATRFVRAELRQPNGSVVFTQPFLIRPRGDVDGDFRVTAQDALLCANLPTRAVPNRIHEAACAARAPRATD